MLIILLSLFVFAKVITGEIDCDKDFFENCEIPQLFDQIPLDVEEFKTSCPELSSFIKCKRDFDMNCEEENRRRFVKPEEYEDSIAVLDEICEEGSVLNKVATSHLKCFNETFSNTNCVQENDAFIELYEKPGEPIDEYPDWTYKVIPERVSCLGRILLIDCIVRDITRNCGLRARFATMEYVHKSDSLDAFCPLSYRETLLPDIDEFPLTEEQKRFAIAELVRMKLSDKA